MLYLTFSQAFTYIINKNKIHHQSRSLELFHLAGSQNISVVLFCVTKVIIVFHRDCVTSDAGRCPTLYRRHQNLEFTNERQFHNSFEFQFVPQNLI